MESLLARSIQLTELRQDIDGALQKTSERELLKIFRRGREIGILMRPETLTGITDEIRTLQDRIEGLEETLAILADKKFLASLKRSLKQMRKGRTKTWEEAFGPGI